MKADGEASDGHEDMSPETVGLIDKKMVAALAEDILERGKQPLIMLRNK